VTKVEINGNLHLLKNKDISPFETKKYREYRNKWKENPVKGIVGRFPLHLDIEVTSACNIKCPFCITTHSNFKNGFMTFETFKSIIDEGSEKGLYAIKMNWRGEPLLHPKIAEMAAYAKEKGILDVFTNTNATLLTKEKSKSLIEAGMDRLIISFEGFEKEIYEANRVGAVFEETLANVKELMQVKKELKSRLPWVRVQTILIDELKDKVDEYTKFWEEIADEVACIDLKNEVGRVVVGEYNWACPQLWHRMTIAWDGRIVPCVNDTFCKMCLGSVPERSVEEAWKSEKMENMRKLHRKGLAHTIEDCLDCPLRSAQILK
jgi:radical SAM protein with 4Fe4S-binding SPASM domain